MKLSADQRSALGVKKQSQIEPYLWSHRLDSAYRPICQTNRNLGGEGQTYAEFLKMEKQPPNQTGTGRYKFSHMDRINLIFIPRKGLPEPSKTIKELISQFVSKYFRIVCQLEPNIKIQVKDAVLIDKKKNLSYQISQTNGMLDAHDILSVLLEYHQEKTILVAFLEYQLHENEAEIDGRAYGDGVAVVYYSRHDLQAKLESYLQTVVHETLHTLGFDHCLAWKCLMNGYTNFQSWLCPACSKKIYHQLNLSEPSAVIEWINQIVQICGKMKAKKTIKKGQMLIRGIQSGQNDAL